jgi:protoheme IX farnesyltransferase
VSTFGSFKDYLQLTKPRLSALVVFSAITGYVIATGGEASLASMLWLMAGGYLVTGASNGFNQVIEKDLDKLMERTKDRPVPAGRLSVFQALTASVIMGAAGVAILWVMMNPLCGQLSLLSLLLYSLVYTPLKRHTPFAVLVGAFPGAFPPMLGWIAARNTIGMEAVLLYALQFIWQFPHFWSIAWILHDDYLKAGFRMLPSAGGRDRSSAFQNLMYTACLIPMSFLPQAFHQAGTVTTVALLCCSLVFTWQAMTLYRTLEIKAAHRLMFGSFLYLPATQLSWMFEKLLS